MPEPPPYLNELLNNLRGCHAHVLIAASAVTGFVIHFQFAACHLLQTAPKLFQFLPI